MAAGLQQLLAMLQGQAQPSRSPLGTLPGLPPPSVPTGMTPEEAAALMAMPKPAVAPDDPWGDLTGAMAKLTKKEGDELSPLERIGQFFKGLGDPSRQAAGQASLAQAGANVGAPETAGLPQAYGPPIPAPEVQGPPVPSAMDVIRWNMQQQMGMPGGLPPSGAGMPGTVPQVSPPSPTASAPASFPPADPMNPGAYPGGSALTPAPAGQTGSNPVADWFWGTPLGAVLQGNVAEGFSRARDNVATWGGEGAKDEERAPQAEAAAAQTQGAFKYRFPGAAPASQQTFSNVTIDPGGGDPIAGYLGKMYGAESGGRMVANAAGASSAFGPAQFTDGTWVDTVRENDPSKKDMSDADILKLRTDPAYHDQMARAFTEGNAKVLGDKGIPVNDQNLYAMHFFGRGAGPKVLAAAGDTPIEQLVDKAAIAANPHLKGMTAQQARDWAAQTINKGGSSGNAYGMPGMTPRAVPELPAPPQMAAPVGIDFSKVNEEMAKIKAPERAPLGKLEHVIALLGGMSAGSLRGNDLGSVLAGLGAGAAQASGDVSKYNRGQTETAQEDINRIARLMASSQENQATAGANVANARNEVTYKNQRSIYETAVANSRLRAEEQNAVAAYKDKVNWAAWEKGQPQVAANEKGLSVITRTPDGKINIQTQSYQDFDKQLRQIDQMAEALGDDDTSVKALKANLAAQRGGELGVRRMMLKDMVEGGGIAEAIGKTEFDNLQKAIEKDIPNATILKNTKPEEYQKIFNERAVDVLMQNMLNEKLPDTWIEQLAAKGHPAAMTMVKNGR